MYFTFCKLINSSVLFLSFRINFSTIFNRLQYLSNNVAQRIDFVEQSVKGSNKNTPDFSYFQAYYITRLQAIHSCNLTYATTKWMWSFDINKRSNLFFSSQKVISISGFSLYSKIILSLFIYWNMYLNNEQRSNKTLQLYHTVKSCFSML